MRVGDGERETGGRRRRGRGIEIRSCIYTRAEIMATEQELKANRTESTLGVRFYMFTIETQFAPTQLTKTNKAPLYANVIPFEN